MNFRDYQAPTQPQGHKDVAAHTHGTWADTKMQAGISGEMARKLRAFVPAGDLG